MNWSNVKLLLLREIRDQLRDRRTLFMIAVLPILLYPLLGMSFLQVAQFRREKPSSVFIVGAGSLADLPPLVENSRFANRLFDDVNDAPPGELDPARLLILHFARDEPGLGSGALSDPRAEACLAVERGEHDVAIYFPPDFADRLEAFRQSMQYRLDRGRQEGPSDGAETTGEKLIPQIPRPEIIYSTANEKSQIAFARVFQVLERWRQEILKQTLTAVRLPASAVKPFEVNTADVAEGTALHGTAVWSKILPVLLLVWAMTGAFYPAVDLCAGEKERGTLETLLCSPAERSEIVLGKLATIMLFSMATAVWNLVSMGITGWLLLARLPQFGPPPPMAAVWLSIALVPVSALFGALCLALAAFARSTKEGQYYLMPLLFVTMPLVILPMAPGVELNLGNSLIPVTGLVLLLRSMLDGSLMQTWPLALPVAAVTLGCCWLSIRWAIEQFNSESVLFRESERLDVRLRLRHLLTDRRPTPTVGGAVFCGVVILLVSFFVSAAAGELQDFRDLAVLVLVSQLAVIAAPALLMTAMLTTSPRQTLLLRRPAWLTLPAAGLLAVVLHPAVRALQAGVMHLYPPSKALEEFDEGLQKMLSAAPFWQVVLLLALTPAICEELAFRGFILSGFRHLGRKWRAIIYSAVFFGLTHMLLQQSLIACLVGVVIGYIAVQSGSILPGVIFHVVHNTLTFASIHLTGEKALRLLDRWPLFGQWVSLSDDGNFLFRWPAVVASALLTLPLLWWFGCLPYAKSAEERQHEALRRASHAVD